MPSGTALATRGAGLGNKSLDDAHEPVSWDREFALVANQLQFAAFIPTEASSMHTALEQIDAQLVVSARLADDVRAP